MNYSRGRHKERQARLVRTDTHETYVSTDTHETYVRTDTHETDMRCIKARAHMHIETQNHKRNTCKHLQRKHLQTASDNEDGSEQEVRAQVCVACEGVGVQAECRRDACTAISSHRQRLGSACYCRLLFGPSSLRHENVRFRSPNAFRRCRVG